jgi:hypothetical protein
MATRDVNNPRTWLKALRYNPTLEFIGPSPISAAGLDNLEAPHKSLIINHAKSPILQEPFWHGPQCSGISRFNGMETAHTIGNGFVPVVVEQGSTSSGSEARESGGRIEIVLDGTRAIIEGSVPPSLASAVVCALRGRR